MEKNTHKEGLVAAIPFILVAVVVILVLFLIPETKTPELSRQEVVTQSKDREYRFKEKKIIYTFGTDGVLTVSGTGSTPSFDTTEAAQKYYMEKLENCILI